MVNGRLAPSWAPCRMEDKQFYLSPDLAHRLAAIDVGTNSIRLVVAEALREGQYRVLTEEKDAARLGKNLSSTGRLNPTAVERSLDALRRMKQIADGYQVRELRVIATCAVREAEDGAEFCRRVREEIGLDIEVISALSEAHLAFFSVARSFPLEGKNVAVADIGGGSTEIILASGRIIEDVCTTPLGAVRMTDLYLNDQDPPSFDDFNRLVGGIDRELKRHSKGLIMAPHLLIGSGGTFTSLAEMMMAEKGQHGLPLRGYEITHAEVGHLLDRLRKLPAKARRGIAGLSPERADIIVAGVAIVDRLLRRFKINRLQIHDRGVRDGLLLTMLDKSLGAASADPHDQEAAIERFAANCGCDLKHARQVARLAGLIFSQLLGKVDICAADRPLLEAAARLQDVGYLINYEKHHKHSYHLILNSRLAGFKPQELELIANIARYHRGKEPKKKHENFKRLSAKDQQRVRQLAAILRLAGGFDRSSTQQVQAISVAVGKGEIEMRVLAPQCPEVDLWAARRRAEPFEKVFERKLVIEWQDLHQPLPAKPKGVTPSANNAENGAATKPGAKPRAKRST
ncbi:MAG TPA: Ppx/GppA phosphatase family protein [Pirellulales bacterium]|nr:Ppx/GppA phosphatase family protein [Pirellulales bacterium]